MTQSKKSNLYEDLPFGSYPPRPSVNKMTSKFYTEEHDICLSWITEKGLSEWFSKRFSCINGEQILCNGWIEKDMILMYSIKHSMILEYLSKDDLLDGTD